MKISFATTVLNEEKHIEQLITSLLSQTKLPDEIIIVDGGSTDNTVSEINKFRPKIDKLKIRFKLFIKSVNIPTGRNLAIKNATNEVILSSDAGCILDKNWIKNIIEPFNDSKVDVVAGYYKGLPKNVFQKSLVPYVLVMEDKISPNQFLPATRSMAFRKKVWKKIGGFREDLDVSEDYNFAHKIKEYGFGIKFQKAAIVYWIPRKNLWESFNMFFKFSRGDVRAEIFRSSVILIFTRYFLGFYLLPLVLFYKSLIGGIILSAIFFLYLLWSIKKNYKYVNDLRAFYILPVLQFTADFAVLAGTVIGLLGLIKKFNFFSYIKQNKYLFIVVFAYLAIMTLVLGWGIPNKNHPFPYHMDEWHQLHAVGTTFKYGTPNMSGSAWGTMFHFVLSGIYLIPFVFLKIVNPFDLQIENWIVRERIFEVLRVSTIIWGSLSIFIFYNIAKILRVSKKIALFLFVFNPIWISLSNYFKYDIALIFWINLSIFSFLYFAKNPSTKNYLLSAIPPALALSIKVTAIPMFPIYIFSYFLFDSDWKKHFKFLFIGVLLFASIVVILGMPDVLFGKGNFFTSLRNDIASGSNGLSNLRLGNFVYDYLFFNHYRIIFGLGLYVLTAVSILYWSYVFIKNGIKEYKIEFFLFLTGLIFLISLIPLNIYGGGNRSLVMLPFFVLICSFFLQKIKIFRKSRFIILILLIPVIIIQTFNSFVWVHIRMVKTPQELSSEWIKKNIPQGEIIGIENVPIYQMLPDIIQKEFYFNQHGIGKEILYKYEVIDSQSKKLPNILIVTNGEIENKILEKSPKKDLMERVEKENYKRAVIFKPDFIFFKFIGSDTDYYFSWLLPSPLTTSVYIK